MACISVWSRRMNDYGSRRALACDIQPCAGNGLPLI